MAHFKRLKLTSIFNELPMDYFSSNYILKKTLGIHTSTIEIHVSSRHCDS